MEPARGNEEQISAMTAAVIKVKMQVTKKLVLHQKQSIFCFHGPITTSYQYAKLPPAAMPVENVTRTPPTKYSAA